MLSTCRLLPPLCALALLVGTAPARSAVFTDTAPLVSPPVTVTINTPLLLAFDVGQTFSSIASVHLSLTFAGDLLDPGEMWFVDGYGGHQNMGGLPVSTGQLDILAGGNPVLFADLLDGKFSANINADIWAPNTTFGLASAQLQIDATPAVTSVPEPAALALVASGLIGIAGVRRRRA